MKTEIFKAAGMSEAEEHYAVMPYLQTKDISDAVIHLLSLPEHVNISEMVIKPIGEPF